MQWLSYGPAQDQIKSSQGAGRFVLVIAGAIRDTLGRNARAAIVDDPSMNAENFVK